MLNNEEFKKYKPQLIKQVLEILKQRAQKEAEWLFDQFHKTRQPLTELTERLSHEINHKNEKINTYLKAHPELLETPVITEHLPPLFTTEFSERIKNIPEEYKRAIVSVELACRIVYSKNDSLEKEIKEQII
jgi:ABC-type branched-subunit amino acid transport system ATPase component